MDRRIYFLISTLILLLGSCAQVGSISGGPKDETPPKTVENGVSPQNGSLQFQSKTIVLKFNEYIKLNNPTETISLVPADAKILATTKKKTLTLNIEGDLKPATTYAIYLNATIQDITEGNDSLIQYVFSTGDFIDTLKYTTFVTDAFTYQALKDVLVGLYGVSDSIYKSKPAYFSKSGADGKVEMSYIKPGQYQLVAFEDKNKDLKLQKTERVGFKNQLIQIDSSVVDSIPLRIFKQKGGIKTRAAFQGPALVNVSSNRSLENASFWVNGIPTKVNHIFRKDSVSLLVNHQNKNSLELIVKTIDAIDTLNIKTFETERNKKAGFETNLKNGVIPVGEKLVLKFTDYIDSYDTNLIYLENKDSLKLNYSLIKIDSNKIEVSFQPSEDKLLNLNLLKNALGFKNSNEFLSSKVEIKQFSEAEFGTIILSTAGIPENAFVEILQKNVVLQTWYPNDIKNNQIVAKLLPEKYSFRVVLDENKNQQWDDGSFEEKIQPEEILFFTKGVKVRANWEIEVALIPEK
jgi:hypothetical protein